MTAAALAILIDDGKLNWNDKVIDYLPEFRLVDPYATREFTITDLLTHRSGLPLGAGDLLFWPDSGNSSLNDIFTALSIIKPVSSFRSEFAYDNLLYVLAGEIVARVSGMSWADFIEKRLFKPLGMDDCFATHSRVPLKVNQATPHIYVNKSYSTAPYESGELIGAAGGVNCSVNGVAKWLITQLAHGKLPNNEMLFSNDRHKEMWTPQTIENASLKNELGSRVNHTTYALGWGISDYMGHQYIGHTGGLGGMLTSMLMIPEKNIGILVFTNQQNGYARSAIISQILQGMLNHKSKYTFDEIVERSKSTSNEAIQKMNEIWNQRNKDASHSLRLQSYAQHYTDSWYGEVKIEIKNEQLYFTSQRSPSLKGKIKHFQYNTFIVEWDDRSLLADAYLIFHLNEVGKIENVKMKAFDPRTDFSFDFHHLNFRPVN
jgi:CubicO group peptidase (beta-lactamase class C family)